VYLTASPVARARRRAGELGPEADLEAVAADIARRDQLDSTRAVSPLRRAEDAQEIDTTDMDVAAVVDRLVQLAVGGAGSAERA
jgi:cytidylate kinase